MAVLGHAQVVWTGEFGPDTSDGANWQGGEAPGAYSDVAFGLPGTSGLLLYDGTAWGTMTFNDTDTIGDLSPPRPDYTFSSATGNLISFTLGGDLDVQTPGNVTFDNTVTVTLSGGSHNFNIPSGSTVEIKGAIIGTEAGINQNGGTLILDLDNTFDGGVSVNSGTLFLGSSSAVSDGSVIYGPAGTGDISLYSGATLGVAPAVAGNSITIDNNIGISNETGTITVDTSNGNLTLNGLISGYGGFTKTGNYALTLNNDSSTFFNGVTVTAGTLYLGQSSSVPDGIVGPVGASDLTLFDGTTLGVAQSVAGGTITLHNGVALDSGTVNIDTTYGNLALKGTIYENSTAGLAVHGGGTLALFGQNTYSGGTSVHDGSTLQLGSSSGSTTTAGEGGPITVYYGPAGTGDIKLYDGTTLGVAPNLSYLNLFNNIVLDCTPGTSVNVDVSNLINNGYLEFDGNISGAAAINLRDTAPLGNEVDFYGNNSAWTGGLNILGNTYIYTDNDSGLGSGPISFGNGSTAYLDLGSGNPSIGALSGNAPGSTIDFDSDGPVQLFVNQTVDGAYSGHITGNGSLVKNGSAKLTLSGHNDYTGGTTINAGTLIADGSTVSEGATILNGPVGTGTITINGGSFRVTEGNTVANPITFGASGGTLAGNYTFTTPQTLGANIILSPGNSPGVMTFAAGLTVNNGLTTNIEINAATDNPGVNSDLIAVTGGALDLSAVTAGGYTLKIISLSLLGGNTPGAVDNLTGPASWTIFQSTTLTGFLAGGSQFTLDSSQFVGGGTFSLTQSGNDLVLNFSPVPELSTYALMALGLGTIGLSVLRRRRAT